MQLVIPACGSLLCPWETFREVALSVINSDCINEPFQSTVKEMSGESSTSSNGGDDDKYGFEDYKVILVTVAICIAVFGLLAFGYMTWNHRRTSEKKGQADALSSSAY